MEKELTMKTKITAFLLAAIMLCGCYAKEGGSVSGDSKMGNLTDGATTKILSAKDAEKATDLNNGFGVLGYDLSDSRSTDPKLAGGSVYDIIINEICAKNKSSLKDSFLEYPDWIELYNKSDKAVNLLGCGISDTAAEPLKWVMPSVNIQPNGYLIVFCSDLDKTENELHTNFKISSGEEIILSDKSGKKIDSLIVADTDDDETYGIDKSGSLMILSATPGSSNDGSAISNDPGVLAPVFSYKSGFYSKEFKLTLSASSGADIYYTTDGSVPTKASKKYSSPITVKDRSSEKAVLTYKTGTIADKSQEQFPREEFEKATIIRAIAVDKSARTSSVSTATYFVGSDIAEKYKSVSVLSVVTDPDNLYNSATGIFVAGDTFKQWRQKNPTAELDGEAQGNYNQRGREWEREAHIDYFKNGSLEFSENVGIRTHGGWSRNSQQKSLKFYFRGEYGSKKLKYELFEDNRDYLNNNIINEYKRFMIRNGGNDSFSLLYKDAWQQALVKDFPFATQDSKLAICFLDGEYWGLYTMMEVYDDNYIESHYKIDSDNAVMIKAGSLEEGTDSDWELWQEAFDFVKDSDMSNAENYKKACEYFDMNSLTEYIAYELYIGNEDWLENNWACFRARTPNDANPYADGKWRFMLYDTEYSMDLYGSGRNYRFNIFSQLANGEGHLGPIFKSLLKSREFKAKFVAACEDVMNIAFNPQSAQASLDSYHKIYAPYIPQHFKRYIFWQGIWGIERNRDSWKKWLTNRQSYFPEQMNEVLGLGTAKTQTLSVSFEGKGEIYINNIPVKFTGGSFSGKYFAGYKISIEAKPASGYEFSGWSGGYSGRTEKIELNPAEDLSLKASFVKK